MNEDFMAYLQGGQGQNFADYATGNRVYGGNRSNPTSGPVNKSGYKERDAQAAAKRNAMLRRMKARQTGRFMSSDNLTPGQPIQGV